MVQCCKKIYKVTRLEDITDTATIVMFEKVKFNHLKLLMSNKEINKFGIKFLNQ